MIRGLAIHDVEFVVIGGVAANLLGSARITNDLDVCYNPSDVNRVRLVDVLTTWRAYLRGVEPGLPFTLDAHTLRNAPVMTLIGTEGWIDVMDRVAGIGEYDKVLASSIPASWEDLHFRMISLDALIAAKRAAGRRKDREALLELEALREERKKRGL
jgi:predicted nucleotidyltransferase